MFFGNTCRYGPPEATRKEEGALFDRHAIRRAASRLVDVQEVDRTAGQKCQNQTVPGPPGPSSESRAYGGVEPFAMTSTSTAADRSGVAPALFAPLGPRYDGLSELLSFGQDRRWRRAMVDRIAAARPKVVLDVASGTGKVAFDLLHRTGCRVVGLDLSEEMLNEAIRKSRTKDPACRACFVSGHADSLPFPDGTFDALSFTYLLRYVDDPQHTLDELARVVKPGGVMASVEFLRPPSLFWRFWWWGYTRWLLPLAGWITGGRAWFRVGRFLGPSISAHDERYPVSWTLDSWRRAGFEDVGWKVMSLGGGLVMWGRRAGG